MKKLITRAQQAAAVALAFGPVAALAQSGGGVVDPRVPGASGGRALTTETVLGFMRSVASFLITLSVIIAVIVIVYGGLMWMLKGSDKGKEILTKGIIGVAIVMAVGVILATVGRIVTQQTI